MGKSAAATRHVVERCPCCGVEHDTSVDSICEACDTPLRAWCRTHSRERGWLDGPGCPHCVRDAVRRRRPPKSREKPKSSPRQPPAAPVRPSPPPATPPSPPVPPPLDAFVHRAKESPPVPWGEVLPQAAVKTSVGAVGGALGGGIVALATGADVAVMAGGAAAWFGFVGLVIGVALAWAIALDEG